MHFISFVFCFVVQNVMGDICGLWLDQAACAALEDTEHPKGRRTWSGDTPKHTSDWETPSKTMLSDYKKNVYPSAKMYKLAQKTKRNKKERRPFKTRDNDDAKKKSSDFKTKLDYDYDIFDLSNPAGKKTQDLKKPAPSGDTQGDLTAESFELLNLKNILMPWNPNNLWVSLENSNYDEDYASESGDEDHHVKNIVNSGVMYNKWVIHQTNGENKPTKFNIRN